MFIIKMEIFSNITSSKSLVSIFDLSSEILRNKQGSFDKTEKVFSLKGCANLKSTKNWAITVW